LSNITIEAESSSPLLRRQHRKTFVPSTSEDRDDERLPDIAELLEQEEKRRQQVEARKRMAEVKAAAIRASANAEANLDDDLDIYHDTPRSKPEVRHLKDARGRDVPDARAVLAKTSAIPAVSKQRQAMLRRAGKIARPKEDVTETFVDFAGKAFKHAELKGINAGAVPAGQKKGRDNLISQAQVDAMIRAKHQQQIAALQKKKEEDWGRVRPLPKKEQQDMQAILEMTARAAEDARDESEEDDGEDDEFIPERDDEDQEDGGMEYSGEENGAEEGSDEEVGEDLESVGTDKEALPAVAAEMDEDEIAPVIRRKPRVSNRAVFDSDEEGDTKPPPSTIRPPLAEVTISPQAISLVGQDLDLSGFGSGSVGFSQLFEATQPADQPTAIVRHCFQFLKHC